MLASYLVGLLLLIWVFLFYNIPAIVWLISALIISVVSYNLGLLSLWSSILGLVLFLGCYSVLAVKYIRKKVITSNVIDFFRKQLPQISETESQAIEAGDVWWERDIFNASLDWSKIKEHKLTKLSAQEQSFLNNETAELCRLIDDWNVVSNSKDLSIEAWNYIKENRFFAIALPKQYGGLEFSAAAQSSIVTKIASKSITAAVTVMVPNALGPGELLMHYGTDEQKKHYLPRLAKCEEIPCFALTSTHAGSDAGSMADRGIICKQLYKGEEVLGIRLTFSKRYITLAPVATVIGLAFKLYDPDKLYSDQEDLGITLALIPTNHPGVEIGNRHYALYTPFQNGPISGKDVFIPMSFIIGGNDYIGKGWFMLMECLSGGRGISLPALSTATAQTSYLANTCYSSLRKQFKVPLSKLEGIGEQIAKVSGINFIANAVREVTVSAIDQNMKPAVISGIAKYHMTEFARICINSAMDVHAGKAVMHGPNNYLIGLYLGSPIAITVEGANILTRNLIIFGQGAFRAHPYILKELKALQKTNSEQALSGFDKVLFKHISFVLRNKVRLVTYNIQRAFYYFIKQSNWQKAYAKDIDRMTTALAFATDMALLFLGGKLKFKERMSARLGDVVSNIYMALCVVNYSNHLLKENNKADAAYIKNIELNTRWALDYLLYNAEVALAEFIRNFPNKLGSILMRVLIMPFGRSYRLPSDKLDSDIVKNNLRPNAYLDKLTALCYKENSLLGTLYKTYELQDTLKELLEKVAKLAANKEITSANDLTVAINDAHKKHYITEQEYKQLLELASAIDKIVAVDDFETLDFPHTTTDLDNQYDRTSNAGESTEPKEIGELDMDSKKDKESFLQKVLGDE